MKSFWTIIALAFSLSVFAQCNDLITITKKEFDQYFTKGDTANYSPDFVKHGNTLTVPGSDVILTDSNPDEDGVIVYVPRGVIFNTTYVLETQDEIMNHYQLISSGAYPDRDIIGFPYIFNDYLLAIEDPHTDYPLIVQVWKIKRQGKDFELKKELKLGECSLYDISACISHGHIYIKNRVDDTSVAYYKIKI
ncbi:hypothetical protein ACLI09_08995 [Flavobacterium sp. RHBU_24]|uniref:hypothetical protein n=1 Tax=Flavobacterium sp. RHBU_24 TaxID=3391185 RepID=UPI003984B2E2